MRCGKTAIWGSSRNLSVSLSSKISYSKYSRLRANLVTLAASVLIISVDPAIPSWVRKIVKPLNQYFITGGNGSMKIRPLYDRIVVKRIETQEQMQGGLYIPDSAKEK